MEVATPRRAAWLILVAAVLLLAAAWLAGELTGRAPGRAIVTFVTSPLGDPSPAADEPTALPTETPAPIRLTALGDSVMLAAANLLEERFPGAIVDAAVGRTVPEALVILRSWAAGGELGDVVLIHIGNNGPFSDEEFEEIVDLVGPDRALVLINLVVPRDWEGPNNVVIARGAARHGGVPVVDWHAAAQAHPGLLWDDGVHLRPAGAEFYADLVAPYLHR